MKNLSFSLSLVFLDQITKLLAQKNLLSIFGDFFHFSCNPSIAWSIPLQGFFFWLLWILGNLFFLHLFLLESKSRSKNNLKIFSLLLILSGSFSNALDRIFHGCVIDFIQISSFPIFNLADAFITIGIFLFLWKTYRK